MTFRKALLAATMLALPVAAQSQPVTGLYVGAGIGLNMLMETDVDLDNRFAAPRSGTAEFNYGYVGVISLGWGFGNGVRAEIEGSYRTNDIDTLTGYGLTAPRASGSAFSYGVMGNALYDFDLGTTIPLMPYIGLGAGYIVQNYDRVITTTSDGNSVFVPGSQGRFAYQAILGAAFQLDAVAPGLALTTEYRFMGTLGHEGDAVARRGTTELGSAEWNNFNHSLLLGIRYAFNAAPPPVPVVAPAPAAAPAPARTFLIFFDFDRADLTDRAGTPQYNQALSERRAAAVAAELERRGIARAAMTVQAFGESRPLVPTADGVREPQNRRVEIVLR